MRELKLYVLERKPRVGKIGALVAKPRVVRMSTIRIKRGCTANK